MLFGDIILLTYNYNKVDFEEDLRLSTIFFFLNIVNNIMNVHLWACD